MKTVERQNIKSKTPAVKHSGPDCQRDEHGGNIYRIAQELGVAEDKLIDFSASINPLGISENVKDVISRELDGLVNYPDPDSTELTNKIASHHGIKADTIICGNGSTELIYLLPRALKPEKVLITAPTFSEYERACLLNQELRVKSYELQQKDNFKVDPDEFIAAIREMSSDKSGNPLNSSLVTRHSSRSLNMAFLCNPNNPTGSLLTKDEALEIADAAKKLKCVLIVDEAFIDFIPEESVIGDVKDNPYLIVLRSMTKFYALTGLRIGYGVLHKDLIEKVRDYKEPWTVNNLAQKTAIAALDDHSYADATNTLMIEEKAYMERSFAEMDITYCPSAANYYLLKIKDAGRKVLMLRQKGILVRDCSNFNGLNNSYIRVAVKSHKQNEMLIKELKKICRV